MPRTGRCLPDEGCDADVRIGAGVTPGLGRSVVPIAALLVDRGAGWNWFLARVTVGRDDYSPLPMYDTLWYHINRALWS